MNEESTPKKITALVRSVGQYFIRKKLKPPELLPPETDFSESVVEQIIWLDREHGREAAVRYHYDLEGKIIRSAFDFACPRLAQRTVELTIEEFATQPEAFHKFILAVQLKRMVAK